MLHQTEIDEHSRIYVCDWGNERIQVLDSDGCLYVTESNRHRIQVFEINSHTAYER